MLYVHTGPDRAVFPSVTVDGHTLELDPGATVELADDPQISTLIPAPKPKPKRASA